jgi:hypothetical protein
MAGSVLFGALTIVVVLLMLTGIASRSGSCRSS